MSRLNPTFRRLLAACAAVMLTAILAGRAAAADARLITLGTGGKTGVYYPVGGVLCELLNTDRLEHGIRCIAKNTDGSAANLRALRVGHLDLALVQSDLHFHAYHGTGPFAGVGANRNLRSVFALHPEPFTVVARRDANIGHFRDLKGKRVNIGNPGSGQRGTMEAVMQAVGWRLDDFDIAFELPSGEQAQALCEDRVDAIVFTVGHPNQSIVDAVSDCDAVVVPVTGDAIDRLVADHPYYRRAMIPGGMYPGNPEDVPTFGVGATLMATVATEWTIVHELVRSVFEDFDAFKTLHPALAALLKRQMVTEGLSAPLHFGAIRYYEDAGLEWRQSRGAAAE